MEDVPVHAAPVICCPTRTTTAKMNKFNDKTLARQTSREKERKKEKEKYRSRRQTYHVTASFLIEAQEGEPLSY